MPEGDTIHKTAANLRRALAGRSLARMELRVPTARPTPPPGTSIDDVEARGKHCFVRFDDGSALRTHMGMHGTWHLYRPGEGWRRSAGTARVVIETDEWVAVCFSPAEAELLDPAAVRRNEGTAHLGPDLCLPEADVDAAIDRMAVAIHREPAITVGEALLDQRIAAGIGNVYKSEVCFARGVHPATPLGQLDDAARRALLETAAKFLRQNLTTHRRTTWPGGLAVYGRAGRACPRCGTAIAAARLGDPPRVTYWCPSCQAGDGARRGPR